MKRVMSWWLVAVLVVLPVLLAGLACQKPATLVELQELPWPDLAAADERVVSQLEDQRAVLDELVQSELAAGSEPARRAAEASSEMGLLLMTYEFMETAAVAFDNAVRLAPDDYRWPYLAGYLQAMLGDLESARTSFESSLRLEPKHLQATVRLGEVLADLGESERAKALFDDALERVSSLPRAVAGLARLASESGDDEQAALLYEQVLDEAPAANSVHYALSQAYRRLGRVDDAEYHLARRGDIQVPLEDELTASVAGLGRSPAFFMTRASEAMKNQRYDIAADAYSRVLEFDSESFAAYRGLAFSLDALGDASGALSTLEQALERGKTGDPERDASQRADVYRRLGEIAVVAGDDQRAVAAFEKGVGEVAQRADLRQLLANALARLGRYSEAIEHYDFVLRGLPDDVQTLVRRGTALVGMGRSREGLADLARATELAPDDQDVARRYLAGLEHTGDPRAAALRRRLSSAADRGAESLVAAARHAIEQGDADRSLELLEQALSDEPGLVDARMLLAAILGHLDRFDEAATHFRTVIDRSPRHEQAWQGELTALLMARRYSDARERLREALEVYPRSASIAHTLARLLVSSPFEGDRRGDLGLELVERVSAFADGDAVAETRAMALAEVGRLAEAATEQEEVVGRSPDVPLASARLESYRSGRAWVVREPDELVSLLQSGGTGR